MKSENLYLLGGLRCKYIWVMSLNVLLKMLPPPLPTFPPPSLPSTDYILPAFSSSGKYINPRVSMRFPVWWHNQKILLTLPLGLLPGCYVVLVGVTQPSKKNQAQVINSEPEMRLYHVKRNKAVGMSAALVGNFIKLQILAGTECISWWLLCIWHELVRCHQQEVFELLQSKLLNYILYRNTTN